MDDFSSRIAPQILTAFPQWRTLAKEGRADDGSSYFVLRVDPPPESKAQHPLHIDTSNGEVTVGFDSYHSHYDQWTSDDGKTFGYDAAFDFVKKLLSEEVGVVSWWKDDTWLGSAQFKAGETPSPVFARAYTRACMRSWRGTYSRDVVV